MKRRFDEGVKFARGVRSLVMPFRQSSFPPHLERTQYWNINRIAPPCRSVGFPGLVVWSLEAVIPAFLPLVPCH